MSTLLQLVAIVGICALGYLLASLKSYATKKGENLATKEDVGTITRQVEEVRAEYAARLEGLAQQNRVLIEEARQRHDLKLAALDRRLAAHQEAYALWNKLFFSTHKEDKINAVVLDCQAWLVNNRLYVSQEVATAFRTAYMAASDHGHLLRERFDRKLVEDSWAAIRGAGDVILQAVQLPPLSDGELKLPDQESTDT